MASFNAFAWESFFFGQLERKEAERLLANSDVGTFLIRESSTMGCYSICVKIAESQFHNYLIEKLESQGRNGTAQYKISTQIFAGLPELINHFKVNNLTMDPAPIKLLRPLEKAPLEKVIAKYNFDGERISDLPFEQGELLEVLGKPEGWWWVARNSLGDTGLIPANRVKSCECGDELSIMNPSTNSGSGGSDGKRESVNSVKSAEAERTTFSAAAGGQQLQANCWVKVKVPRIPSIYDADALTIKSGQFLFLQEILPNGMCRGSDGTKTGFFPITYVEPANLKEAGEIPWNPSLANGN